MSSLPDNPIVHELEKQIKTRRKHQFTGVVVVSAQCSHQSNAQWELYFLLGRIVWVKSRIHAIRRWQRHLAIHCPLFSARIAHPAALSYPNWNYTALSRLVTLKQFRRDQFSRIVENCVTEDLFDILYIGTNQYKKTGQTLTYKAASKEASDLPFIMLQQDLSWSEAKTAWQAWEQGNLTKCSPDWALIIAQPEALKEQTPPKTFETLTAVIHKQRTLRDLSGKFKQPLVPLTKSLLPYVSKRLLSFVEITDTVENTPADFYPNLEPTADSDDESLFVQESQPISHSTQLAAQRSVHPSSAVLRLATARVKGTSALPSTNQSSRPFAAAAAAQPSLQHFSPRRANRSVPMVLYVDDSPADSRVMSGIVQGLGYRYTNILDPLQALPKLIELKPKLIFLDLVMPIANGYEVCAQIRRISALREVPVVIVTSNDGIADRVRAKVVGASGFMAKPIREDKVIKVMKKHLDYDEKSNTVAAG